MPSQGCPSVTSWCCQAGSAVYYIQPPRTYVLMWNFVWLYILVFQEVMACTLVDSTVSKNTSYFRVAWIHRQQGFSEMSIPPYQTTWFHMPEVYSLNICCYENCVSLLFVWLELPAVVKLCNINHTAVSSICYTSTKTMASSLLKILPVSESRNLCLYGTWRFILVLTACLLYIPEIWKNAQTWR